jgi:hypothetical protein
MHRSAGCSTHRRCARRRRIRSRPTPGRLRESVLAAVPDDVAARALAAWAGVFGLVNSELFGQFENVVTDRGAFFDHAVRCLGRVIGIPV